MQFSFGQSPPKFPWKWRLAIGCGLIAIGIVWIGADRVPANATRPSGWQGEPERKFLPGNTFRVAAFNIHGGKGADRQQELTRIAYCIADVQPDFVGLNEVHGGFFGTRQNQADELGAILGMASQFVPTERRFWQPSFGNGLLTKVATTPVHKLPLPCTQGKKYRTAALTSFQVGGETVRMLCVHLDRVKDREEQLQRVLSLFCDLQQPAVLMGDLNTLPNDPLLTSWLQKHPEIRDAVGEKLGPYVPSRRIDWILTRGLDTLKAGYLENEASDHPLVWAELQLPHRMDQRTGEETTAGFPALQGKSGRRSVAFSPALNEPK